MSTSLDNFKRSAQGVELRKIIETERMLERMMDLSRRKHPAVQAVGRALVEQGVVIDDDAKPGGNPNRS
jgi:hypothetical protein